jgi:hypothetical protein
MLLHSLDANVMSYYSIVFRSSVEGYSLVFGVCGYNSTIFIVGSKYVNGSGTVFVEARNGFNGELVSSWNGAFIGSAYNCVFVEGLLYVVGYIYVSGASRWFVAIFYPNLTLIGYRFSYYRSHAIAITAYDQFVYVVGFSGVDNTDDVEWIVEMIPVGGLNASKIYRSNPSIGGGDVATCVGVNPVTSHIWVVGLNAERRNWRVEVLSRDLKRISLLDLDVYEYPYALAFDLNGNGYIAGVSNVVKVSKDLKVVKWVNMPGTFTRASVVNNGLIVVSNIKSFEGLSRHYITIFNTDLDLVYEICLSCDLTYSANLVHGAMYLDDSVVYTAGSLKMGSGSKYVPQADVISEVYAIKLHIDALSRLTPIPLTATTQQEEDHPLASIVTMMAIALCIMTLSILYKRRKAIDTNKKQKSMLFTFMKLKAL